MASSIQVEVMGLEDIQERLIEISPSRGMLRRFLFRAAGHAQKVAKGELADRGTGLAEQTIFRQVDAAEFRVYSVMPDRATRGVEFGRAPGSAVPPRVFRNWAQAVGYPFSLQVLAEDVKRRGTKGRFFLQAARKSVQESMPAWLDELAEEVRKKWGRA